MNETVPVALRKPWAGGSEPPFVRIQKITKRFGDFTAVEDVSLDIYKGELFCLLGGSGCGKSTLLRMLAGFETPSSGRIEIDGQDMAGKAPYERPTNMMFQSYALFPHMSVEKNVAYGLQRDGIGRAEAHDRATDMLKMVQLSQFAGRKPHQLSGGQRQRVALARVILKDAPILVLDEATSALDSEVEAAIQETLYGVMQGKTVIAIAHRLSTIAQMDRIVVLDDGRVAEQGSHAELLAKSGLYAGFWQRQAGGFIGADEAAE